MSEELKEIALDERCPCESGAVYGECCHGNVTWVKNDKGEYHQRIRVENKNFWKIVEKQMKFLEKKYGRPLKPSDKIFPDIDLNEFAVFFLKFILEMGASAAEIYATCRMDGFFITEKNKNKATTADRNQYEGLINEFKCFSESEKTDALFHGIKKYAPTYNISRKDCLSLIRK